MVAMTPTLHRTEHISGSRIQRCADIDALRLGCFALRPSFIFLSIHALHQHLPHTVRAPPRIEIEHVDGVVQNVDVRRRVGHVETPLVFLALLTERS